MRNSRLLQVVEAWAPGELTEAFLAGPRSGACRFHQSGGASLPCERSRGREPPPGAAADDPSVGDRRVEATRTDDAGR